MNINGNSTNSWYQQQHQLFYTTMNHKPTGYYPNMEKTNFGNILAKNAGFSNQPQQRNHHTMSNTASSSSGYINLRDQQRNRYPNKTQQFPKYNHYHHNQLQQQNIQSNMSSNNGIMNGIKSFVNGFIGPKLNCNFYTDRHHRNYDPKYRNNFMRNEQQINNNNNMHRQQQQYQTLYCQPETHIQTVYFNLTVEPKIISTSIRSTDINTPIITAKESAPSIDQVDHCILKKSDNIAIFTIDDFPELPVPKQKININIWNQQQQPSKQQNEKSKESSCPFYNLKSNCKTNNKNKMKQNKKQSPINATMKPPTIDDDDDDDDNSDNCSFNNIGCSSNSFSTNTENVQQDEQSKSRKESECDSEDSFIIFTNQSPSNYNEHIILNYNCKNKENICNKNMNKNAGTTPFRPIRTRERQISECSDDSFIICFTDDAAEGIIEFSDGITSSDDDDDDTDTDTNYETDDDDEDDDVDEIDNETDSKIKVVNKIINNNEKTENNINNHNGGSQPDSGFDERKDKKVRFNLNLEVHTMHTWSFAYRAARKGHWENYVRDRSRFGDRIKRLATTLNPILASKHRENVYKLRFCDNNDTIS